MIYKSLQYVLPSFSSICLLVQEEKRKYFQDGGHLGFSIGTILAIFYQQVHPILSTKFRVNWHLGSGEEAQERFSRWPPWRVSWISDQSDSSYFFYLQFTPILSTKFLVEEAQNRLFKMAAIAAILIFELE